jgi:hypothetical protein
VQSKAKIFNLALSALLLQRRIVNTETDTSNEGKVLESNYDIAFMSALEDMDLDATSSIVTLELVEEEPNDLWYYAYQYPRKCAFLRRLISGVNVDTRATHIDKRIGIHEGQKVIFTNLMDAKAEIIMNDVPLVSLSSSAIMTIAYRLASLSAPLIVGKGADKLMQTIQQKYLIAKAEAQDHDHRENLSFLTDEEESEFVAARTE